ncbi:MAG TPA: NADPH-dependent F420 reductase [Candidatus Bathyarchaeia archaeon]|nr:NADPH-dependent F420 reductase [Candidatus Bathyarchaeia archaeon]
MMKIAMIGKGNVGTALSTGWQRAGHEIRFGHRDPNEPVRGAAEWGETVVLAVPFAAVSHVTTEIGSAADGKVLIDVTNALGPEMELAVGFSTSSAEEIQKALPEARVVKAFNTVFAQNQSTARVGAEQLSAFVAGDDDAAKRVVMQLAADIGFDPIDVGTLKSARYLEPMGMLLISLGYNLKMGTNIGLKLIKG